MNNKLLNIIATEFESLLGHPIDPKSVRVYTLVKQDYYIGHRYQAENLVAFWCMDRKQIDIYDFSSSRRTMVREITLTGEG